MAEVTPMTDAEIAALPPWPEWAVDAAAIVGHDLCDLAQFTSPDAARTAELARLRAIVRAAEMNSRMDALRLTIRADQLRDVQRRM